MPYQITSIEKDGLVVIKVTEFMNSEVAEQISKEIKSTENSKGLNKYLFDMRESQSKEALPNIYKFVSDLEKFGFRRSEKIALLYESDEMHHKFAESVAVNIGFQVKAFRSEKEALDWLRNE
jgi:hypothetical protein